MEKQEYPHMFNMREINLQIVEEFIVILKQRGEADVSFMKEDELDELQDQIKDNLNMKKEIFAMLKAQDAYGISDEIIKKKEEDQNQPMMREEMSREQYDNLNEKSFRIVELSAEDYSHSKEKELVELSFQEEEKMTKMIEKDLYKFDTVRTLTKKAMNLHLTGSFQISTLKTLKGQQFHTLMLSPAILKDEANEYLFRKMKCNLTEGDRNFLIGLARHMAKKEDEQYLKGNEQEKEHILESLILD